jgi:Secretion system C-terminal sorting domain/PKD domain
MKALGLKYRIIVWQSIGLNDRFGQATNVDTFQARMQRYRTFFRQRYNSNNIHFLSTNFDNPPASTFDWNYVWPKMAAADPLFHEIDVHGATYMDGGSHFDHDGFKLISKRMADATMLITGGTGTGGSTYTIVWSKVSGPAGGTIVSPNSAATSITGLVTGTYIYRLSVTDNLGITVTDDVQVTVPAGNQPPVANAGADINITLPVNATTLNGTASTDVDGTITTYAWTKISGPATFAIANAAAASTGLNNLVQGVYSFRLRVTDNAGAVSSDTVKVTVNAAAPGNQNPLADAGGDINLVLPVNSTTLNGTASTDPDGTITIYAWTKISGPATFTIANAGIASTGVSNLVQGVYSFRLQVTDNAGATSADTVIVTVDVVAPPANLPPVANAGTDISITLPVNTTTLNGTGSSDPDGTITNYSWTKISGPAQFSIASPAAASTALNNLVQGVYLFRLRVTDNSNARTSDTVKVTVNPAPPPPNQAPIANAGADITITLPTNTATLDGSASSDPDGSITSYAWTKISGPAQFTIANGSTTSTGVSNLVQGVYSFRLQVTDNSGATASDTVKVTVNAVPPGNQPPIANAGTDIIITLPTNIITLNGTASNDPDGTIAAYAWTRVSGPAQFTIANAGAASTVLSNLVQGVYTFRLQVLDNGGATASDTITVTVNAAPPPVNQPPVANAGADISITLPINTATLNGTASSDPDGTIAAYTWSKISGPAQFTIVNPGSASTVLGNLVQGVYTFRLQVFDNGGASATATVTVTVNAALPPGNQAPIANAGNDITLTLPASTANLNGTASNDPDGTISSYSWNKISGPGAITIVNSNTATPSATGLVAGQYVFELTVTDNAGATGKDQVSVTVGTALPIANAGQDTVISLPSRKAKLIGTKSKDPNGIGIVKYSWRQFSGPTASVISNPLADAPDVDGLAEGEYVFELTVTNAAGLSASASVKVTVVNNFRVTQYFNIYPNPINNGSLLNLQYADDKTGKLRVLIYDAKGSKLIDDEYSKPASTFSTQLNVNKLKPGMYYVQIMGTDGSKFVRPFVKQ